MKTKAPLKEVNRRFGRISGTLVLVYIALPLFFMGVTEGFFPLAFLPDENERKGENEKSEGLRRQGVEEVWRWRTLMRLF